jgi:hypothetical protein
MSLVQPDSALPLPFEASADRSKFARYFNPQWRGDSGVDELWCSRLCQSLRPRTYMNIV